MTQSLAFHDKILVFMTKKLSSSSQARPASPLPKSLQVIHLSKEDSNFAELAKKMARLSPHGFFVDTCQRQFLVLASPSAQDGLPESLPESLRNSLAQSSGIDVLTDEPAYRLLLEISTGLKSAIQGETDIFGQLKNAWQQFETQRPDKAKEISSWIIKLFEDTKEIRCQYLQNIGGDAYGSLVRKLLRPSEKQKSLSVNSSHH